jgi:acyl-coenzyme A thioesterase PaaI-like protein
MATKAEITAFFEKEIPHFNCIIEEVGNHSALTRHLVGERELRFGGTVSGPTLMAAADVSLYVAIIGEIGLVTQTATTSLNINFLRKPAGDKDIICKCKLIKVGRTLIVGEVSLYSEGDDREVAHAVGTYAVFQ